MRLQDLGGCKPVVYLVDHDLLAPFADLFDRSTVAAAFVLTLTKVSEVDLALEVLPDHLFILLHCLWTEHPPVKLHHVVSPYERGVEGESKQFNR